MDDDRKRFAELFFDISFVLKFCYNVGNKAKELIMACWYFADVGAFIVRRFIIFLTEFR